MMADYCWCLQRDKEKHSNESSQISILMAYNDSVFSQVNTNPQYDLSAVLTVSNQKNSSMYL